VPATSQKQERFMQAVAHNPKFAKQVGVPQRVGKEFTKSEGGQMKESKAMVKKEIDFMKKKGAPKSMVKHEMSEAKKMAKGGGIEKKGKTEGKMVKMACGGMTKDKKMARGGGIETKGKTKCKVM